MSKKILAFLPLLPFSGAGVEVVCDSMRVVLDERDWCAVSRIVSVAGTELAATNVHNPLFSVKVTRTDDFMKSVTVEPSGGLSCEVQKTEGGVNISYSGFAEAVENVICTVRGEGRKIRWSIGVRPRPGWAVEETTFPRLATTARIGTVGTNDAVVIGMAKGGLRRNPCGRPFRESARQPGGLACQFASHFDGRVLFMYAAEDGRGYAKRLDVEGRSDGVRFAFSHVGFDEQPFTLGYDVVTACLDRTDGRDLVWQDGADLYREWARRQSWCGRPLRDRTDVPAWMREAPAMVRFDRNWLREPDRIRAWMRKSWKPHSVGAPLIVAFFGWERHGAWVSDYFPVYPDNERFAELVRDLRTDNAHAFVWPSGYRWILDFRKGRDGSFAFTDYARYRAANGDDYACRTRAGKAFRFSPPWLFGGTSTCLCGGTSFCRNRWNESVCRPLAELGCELIQVDQIVGGSYPPCWNRTHGHAPGEGLWKRDCFHQQLVTMRETMRNVLPDAVVGYEEPCELFNDLVGIQDYRACEARVDEWASVFNYVYHEWVPCFQSNPIRYDRIWKAQEAADGQMPHLTPDEADLTGETAAVLNGGFETVSASGEGFVGWNRVEGAGGVAWRGHASVDRETRHDGVSALRLECAQGERMVQLAQNVPVDGEGFREGGRYRLSAWMKCGSGGEGRLASCFLGEKGGGASGNVALVPRGEDRAWQHVSADFTVAKGAKYLRLMAEAREGSALWIDSVKLESVGDGGLVRPVVLMARAAYAKFVRSWISLYHGHGRDWLAHGRQIRPPQLECATVPFKMTLFLGARYEGRRPAVFHSAWESLDGRKALVFANATDEVQPVSYRWAGMTRRLLVQPDAVMLVEVK